MEVSGGSNIFGSPSTTLVDFALDRVFCESFNLAESMRVSRCGGCVEPLWPEPDSGNQRRTWLRTHPTSLGWTGML